MRRGWIIAALVMFAIAGLTALSTWERENAYEATHPASDLAPVIVQLAFTGILLAAAGVCMTIGLLARARSEHDARAKDAPAVTR